MTRKPILLTILMLVLASLACTAPKPPKTVAVGPLETETINIPAPDAAVVDVDLQFGIGELNIDPGAEESLVEGRAKYNVDDLAPKIEVDETSITIRNDNPDDGHFFNVDGNVENKWDLQLGTTPINLRITAGAYQGRYELGGLAIEKLTVRDGAADVRLNFDEPNLAEMRMFSYSTGASSVKLTGLANANFEEMEFQGGAGDYTLDFTGELLRDADVTVDAGISSVTILVPEGVNVRLSFDGGLSNVDVHGEWEQDGTDYVQSGTGPTLTIRVKMGAGNLSLDNP
jgi:hypothetical protein